MHTMEIVMEIIVLTEETLAAVREDVDHYII